MTKFVGNESSMIASECSMSTHIFKIWSSHAYTSKPTHSNKLKVSHYKDYSPSPPTSP